MPVTAVGACCLMILTEVVFISTACETLATIPPTHGKACQPFDYNNITAIIKHHCSLACAARNECHAIIFDTTSHVCMLLMETCLTLQPYPGHIYQSFKHECIKWVPGTGNFNAYWFFVYGSMKNIVARAYREGEVIVGKVTNKFHGVSSDGTYFKGVSYEQMVVHPSCDVTWVSYNSSSGLPLPSGALIGGILMTTNTPLYVVRVAIAVNGYLFSGYFNPLNELAWTEYLGTQSSDLFEVMVVQPR